MKIFFTSVTFALMLALLWPFSSFAASNSAKGKTGATTIAKKRTNSTATIIKRKTKRGGKQQSSRFVNPVKSLTAHEVYAPGEIIVKLREDRMNLEQQKGKIQAQTFTARHKLVIKDWLTQANTIVVSAKGKQSFSDVIAQLKKDPDVAYAEPNFRQSLQKRK